MKITFLDGYAANPGDISYDIFNKFGDFKLFPRTAPNQVLERAKDSEIILTNKVVFGRQEFEQLPKLKYLGVVATGYNIIDIEAAKEFGVAVTNVPAYSTDSVAQHVFSLILGISQRIEKHAREVAQGAWHKAPDFCYWSTPQIELVGLTIGLIGLGSIAHRVAEIATAFRMNVVGCSPSGRTTMPEIIKVLPIDQVLAQADFVSLHCPQTEATMQIINSDSIAKMKDGAVLINTSRGGVLDEKAVATALASGKLRAAGIDVLSSEPPQIDNPLISAPNCFITPHIAWASISARQRLIKVLAKNVESFLAGELLNRIV